VTRRDYLIRAAAVCLCAAAFAALAAAAQHLCPYRLAQRGYLREDGVFTPFSPEELAAAALETHDNVPFAPPDGPTNPFGVAHGVLPGRVTWAWFEGAARWNGSSTNYWWQPHNVDQRAVDEMFSAWHRGARLGIFNSQIC